MGMSLLVTTTGEMVFNRLLFVVRCLRLPTHVREVAHNITHYVCRESWDFMRSNLYLCWATFSIYLFYLFLIWVLFILQ